MRSRTLAVEPKQLQKVMQSICKNFQQGHKATLPVGARSFLELQTYLNSRDVGKRSGHSLEVNARPCSQFHFGILHNVNVDILQGHARKDCCIIAYVRGRGRKQGSRGVGVVCNKKKYSAAVLHAKCTQKFLFAWHLCCSLNIGQGFQEKSIVSGYAQRQEKQLSLASSEKQPSLNPCC